jgi:drug/metabolite transporter (DMT)-like permease
LTSFRADGLLKSRFAPLRMTTIRVFVLTALAMIAFASNSLLCRLALKHTSIDAASFTLIRIVSGALCLGIIVLISRRPLRHAGNWPSALALFGYAALFSFAYLHLTAGTGALLLFGAVQTTMIIWALKKGERLRVTQIAGLLLALSGLVALVFPGLSAPPLGAAALMLGAGIAWGVYSLRGKGGGGDPLRATAGNFLRAVPMAVLVSLVMLRSANPDRLGIAHAVLSGAIASGVGYAIWYTALPALKASGAATVQLSVPVLAAAGGIVFLGEPITLRFAIASIAVLGGIALVILERRPVAS